MMHVFMGLMNKMMTLLMNRLSGIPKAEEEAEKILAELNLKLVPPDKYKTYGDRFTNSRWGRPDWITLYRNIEKFIALISNQQIRNKVGKTN